MGDVATESVVEILSEVLDKVEEDRIDKVKENVEETLEDEVLEDRVDSNGSEYESVDSANSSREDNGEQEILDQSDGEFDEQDDGSEGSVTLEREEGDGQESVPTKKVDDDEDKKNPQYIPKRGTFYEHDDRTLEDENDDQEPADKLEKQTKKNVWLEKKERWSHDRFDDKQQAPKSRSELVAIYGYDIRNEDGPPRARRRRRYGRGPNKYTRTWEDEDAYKPTKPVNKIPVKKPKARNQNEFPPLSNTNRGSSNSLESEDIIRNNNLQETELIHDEKPISSDTTSVRSNNSSSYEGYYKSDQNARVQQQRVGTGRVVKPKPEVKKEIKDSDYTGMTRTRQYRNSKFEQKVLPRGHNKEPRDTYTNSKQNNIQSLERDLNKLNIQDGGGPKSSNKPNNSRQSSVPPRLQAEHKASKRYSSIRLRSLPETTAPPFAQQSPTYYQNDYNQPASIPQQPPALLPQPNPIHSNQVPQIPPPQLAPIPQQTPVTATSILQAPPQYAPPFPPPPPAFLQPNVAASFLPQQPPPIINYVSGQPQFSQPPPFQSYQHQQFNAVTPPAELYQCQGGTTYYSTQNQHLGQRQVPLKRPKAAIPIVPPPPQEPRGRGRLHTEFTETGEEYYEKNGGDSSNYDETNFVMQ